MRPPDIKDEAPLDWLLPLEIYELCLRHSVDPAFAAEVKAYLKKHKNSLTSFSASVQDGLALAAEY